MRKRSFIQIALKEEASRALEKLDRSKTCPCGITFPVFTHAEYVAYNRHLCKFHRDLDKFKPFLCPVPGCNIRRTSQTCLDKHVEDSHGEMHVCRHCGKKFRKLHLQSHENKCTKTYQCKVCGKQLNHQQVNYVYYYNDTFKKLLSSKLILVDGLNAVRVCFFFEFVKVL